MKITLSILVVVITVACTGPSTVPDGNSLDYEKLYNSGVSYSEFMETATKRRAMWLANRAKTNISDALLKRARSVDGTWRLLVVAEAGCSDSANTIPYIATLVSKLDNVEMRIINSKVGREIMESHRTPDDRAATPTVLLLDENYRDVGSFVERPAVVREWALANRDGDDYMSGKFEQYDLEGGRETTAEIVELIEIAAEIAAETASQKSDY